MLQKLPWVIPISRTVKRHFVLFKNLRNVFVQLNYYSVLSLQTQAATPPTCRSYIYTNKGFNHFPGCVAGTGPSYDVARITCAWGRDSLTLWQVWGGQSIYFAKGWKRLCNSHLNQFFRNVKVGMFSFEKDTGWGWGGWEAVEINRRILSKTLTGRHLGIQNVMCRFSRA